MIPQKIKKKVLNLEAIVNEVDDSVRKKSKIAQKCLIPKSNFKNDYDFKKANQNQSQFCIDLHL